MNLETKLKQGLRKYQMLTRYTKAGRHRRQLILNYYEGLNK